MFCMSCITFCFHFNDDVANSDILAIVVLLAFVCLMVTCE